MTTRSTPLCRAALTAVGLLLAACTGKEKKKADDYAGLKWEQRINRQIRNPESIKSPFTNEIFKASQAVRTGGYRTQDFQGGRSFTGADERYQTGAFTQAARTSKSAQGRFSGADDRSQLAQGTYTTTDSRFNGSINSNADKTSPLADSLFKTSANPVGSKAISNSKRPLIQDQGKPGYTEDEVRSILSKQ